VGHGGRKGGKRSKSETLDDTKQMRGVHVELVHGSVKVKHGTAHTDTTIFVMQYPINLSAIHDKRIHQRNSAFKQYHSLRR
jgi:hypothetical protein